MSWGSTPTATETVSDGEGHFTVHPDDLQRVYGS